MSNIDEERVIGIFMGATFSSQGYPGYYAWDGFYNYNYYEEWEHTMPVVEKIETEMLLSKKWYVNINGTDCSIYDESFKNTGTGVSMSQSGNTKIEAVWKTIVQFLVYVENQNS